MGVHAAETEDGGGCCDMRAVFWEILPGILGALLALVIMVPLLYYPFQWSVDNGKSPEYSVAVAAFSGLDPARAIMDPTFDLTVRIKEPRKWSTACVERDTTAVVSYRGARLASGPVPGFCGRNENTTEAGSVMAWGTAVPVPQFARDRLAEELARGEAAVDVALMGPARYCVQCVQTVIECKPRLGRGEASPPCSVRYEHPTLPDDPARRLQEARKQLRTPQEPVMGGMEFYVSQIATSS
ncbi:hypothetical protein BAE44_0010478 [Dichanthelium oligosanthes]|uniref:Uncharacterized protein n=1 Tax=Dichanthelium oligosanthes TaxID=888268 RepID=A0A1E5VTR7_9POAL|nr:hypothetical protein BAE44_0010478 [Dichanthelium oligosanthes]